MNRQLSTELHDAVKQAEADEAVGCIVITGAGNRAFSAGGDIHEQRENDVTYTREELDARGAVRSRGSYEISACAKPTIGMMESRGAPASCVTMLFSLSRMRSNSPITL